MKIVLGVGSVEFAEKGANATEADIRSTATNYAMQLGREFRKRGIEVGYYCLRTATREYGVSLDDEIEITRYYTENPPPTCDHFICLEQSGFIARHPAFLESVRRVCKGKIATICDHDLRIGDEDYVFHARLGYSGSSKAIYSGWGVDPVFFRPEQEVDCLNIFIDHKEGADVSSDNTESIITQACEFACSYEQGRFGKPKSRIRIVFLGPTGLEILDPHNPPVYNFTGDRSTFTKRLPLEEVAVWYRRADIFLVTHSESMGFPVLEAAMSGALVVAPLGYIHPELIRPLSHVEYTDEIPWRTVLNALNPVVARHRALPFQSASIADRMLAALTGQAVIETRENGERTTLVELHPGYTRIVVGNALSTDLKGLSADWDLAHLVDTGKNQAWPGSLTELSTIEEVQSLEYHYLQRTYKKLPQSEKYCLSLFVRPSNADGMGISLFGGRHDDSLTVYFDLKNGTLKGHQSQWLWKFHDAGIMSVGDGLWWCWISTESDYATKLGTMIMMLANDKPRYTGRAGPLLALGGIRLERGISPSCLMI